MVYGLITPKLPSQKNTYEYETILDGSPLDLNLNYLRIETKLLTALFPASRCFLLVGFE